MLSVVADWKASGLTQKAFGLLHNIWNIVSGVEDIFELRDNA